MFSPTEFCAVMAAAADNDLYRASNGMGVPPTFRNRDGAAFDLDAVLVCIANGLLGPFQRPEQVDGVWLERIDLSEHGLEWWLDALARTGN